MNKITYKIISNVMDVRQDTTTFDLRHVADSETYNYVYEKANERFDDYNIEINNPGRVIVINYK